MITTLVIREGNQRLEIECPDGNAARALLARCAGHNIIGESTRTKREIEIPMMHDRVLEVFNGDDDKFMREMRDRTQVKIQSVVERDPGSVAGNYWDEEKI